MPKSKMRGKHTTTHYNPYAGVLVGESKYKVHRKRSRPVPGSTHRINRRSSYMGSVITADNRRTYMKQQGEAFKENYINDVISKREKIESQTDKSQDQIEAEVLEFNSKQLTESELEALSKRFGIYQCNKENRHYEAWLNGKSSYNYVGKTFPVLTEAFLKRSKSIKDIVKVEPNDDERTNGDGDAESSATAQIHRNNEGRDDKALRSNTDTIEANEL